MHLFQKWRFSPGWVPAALLAALTMASGNALAAPQILGLVATKKPTPLVCTDGVCSAQFLAFCLQQHRKTPEPGTAYKPADGTRLSLTVTGSDGIARVIAVDQKVKIRSTRGFTAVAISLPESVVRSLGKGSAALSVVPMASALPVSNGEGAEPRTRAEIETYTKIFRPAAEQAAERDSGELAAARILNRMMNDMPAGRRIGSAEARRIWKNVVGREESAETSKHVQRTQKVLDRCSYYYRYGSILDMRDCVGSHMDQFIADVTQRVWKSLRPGS